MHLLFVYKVKASYSDIIYAC